jgi:hypothetical protein
MWKHERMPLRERLVARLTLIVLAVGLVVTASLAFLAATADNRNENRLLSLQVSEAGIALAAAIPAVQTPLAAAAATATATNGDAASFDSSVASFVGAGRAFAYAALCDLRGGQARTVATSGQTYLVSPNSNCQFFADHPTVYALAVTGFADRGTRIGYAYRPTTTPSNFGIYVETALSPNRRVTLPKSFAFSDLDYALYLGKTARPSALVEATTSQLPITGRKATTTFPFANTSLTLVGTSTQALGGALSRRLALIVALLGIVLTIGAFFMTERLTRRRRSAERLAAENRRLYAEQASIARTLQRALLPDELPRIEGLATGARYVAGLEAMDVGGDWYDVVSVADDLALFVVGDVSGKGMEAATLMASLHHSIRAYAAQGNRPDDILSALCHLLDIGRDEHFATILCGTVDVRTRQVSLASAGHFPPLLITGTGAEFVPMEVGPPIGVETDTEYTPTTFTIPEGSTLLAFTDGLIERRGESLDVGLARLRHSADGGDRQLDELLTDLIDELTPDGSVDDVAVLALRSTHVVAGTPTGSEDSSGGARLRR